jgi:hypothetical protein
MKKILYYALLTFLVINGAYIMNREPEWTFLWCMGLFNVMGWGGYLLIKLMDYLQN